MAPELSPALVRSALELAGATGPNEDTAAGAQSTPATSERLGAHQVLRYATSEEAETYRRIMRVLYLEHQSFGLRLRPAQVADRLRDRYALRVDPDLLEERLTRLDRWGAVERDHDASLASTAAEWRRNRYTYDVTPAGQLTEELLTRLDALGAEIGRLDTARLPAIRDALANLADELDQDQPDGTRLRTLLERLLAEVEALHAGALTFMRSLGDLMRTVDRVGEAEFERGKGALLEHLQGFRKSRMRHSAEILTLIERIERRGPDQLVGTIVAAEAFVALPGGATVDDQRAGRGAELLDRWARAPGLVRGRSGQRLAVAHAQRPGRGRDSRGAGDRRKADRAPFTAHRSRRRAPASRRSGLRGALRRRDCLATSGLRNSHASARRRPTQR